MKFDSDLFKVKALTMPNGTEGCDGYEAPKVVVGWYYWNVCDFVDVQNDNYADKLEFPTTSYEVNTYSICRNTGTKVLDTWLFEFDLVQFTRSSQTPEMGIIVWDDFTRGWAIQGNANYSGLIALHKVTVKSIVGNVILSHDDAKIFQQYSDNADKKYSGLKPDTECRSTQHIRKLRRQFLPKTCN